jgi:hypothetical protein
VDAEELGRCIDAQFNSPGHRLFRMEVLPEYAVESDGEDFQRWLDGAPEPTWTRKRPWLETLRRERANRQITKRVRILSEHVTAYERYECEFGYAYNMQAGEEIRVLRRGEHAMPDHLIERDFWLVNDNMLIVMFYDSVGSFAGAEVSDPGDLTSHRRARDCAWEAAEPFDSWWARHSELHRGTVI